MNIAVLLDATASMYPERVAVSDGDRALSYAELQRRAGSWSAWLARRGGPGRLCYLGPSRADMVEILFGCAIAGWAFVPLNYRAKQAETLAYLATAGPRAVLHELRYADLLAGARVEAVPLGSFEPPDGEAAEPVDEPRGPAVCLFTSGTTASPKLVLLTHDNLSTYVVNTVEAGSSSSDEATLIATPPYHIAWVANVLSNVFRGRRLVLLPQFDGEAWLALVGRERITHAMVVPTMLARILDALEARPELAPRTLTSLAYGGARAPEGLVERAMRVLPKTVGLVNAFGLTETSSTVALLGPEDHRLAFASADPAVRARLRSIGKPVPGVELRIARENGAAAAVGEQGQLWIRGAQVSSGHEGRVAGLDPEGWLRTGDRAYADDAGYVFVVGRSDDVVIRGGENIDPVEIEEVLERHPSVREAAVVGLPDAEWGQVLGALVVGDPIGDDELRAWVRGHLAGYKAPVRIRWTTSLPRTETGKLIRRAAQAALAETEEIAT